MTSVQLVYLAGSPAALIFPIYYHMTARWWRTREGRLFMANSMVPFMLYFSVVLFLTVPEGIAKDAVRLLLVAIASVTSWANLVVYIRIRREGMQRMGSKGRWMKQNRNDQKKGGERNDLRS